MKASLQLKASQHLAMTPQLQQSIRLLQLSSVELQQEVAQALAENPMLEREEGDEGDPVERDTETQEDTNRLSDLQQPDASSNALENPRNEDELPDTAEAFEQSNPIDIDEGPYDYSSYGGSGDDDFEHEQGDSNTVTLREHLLTQAGLLRVSWREQALVRILIEALDERGYLTSTLTELQTTLPADEAVTMPELDAALHHLQEMDPPGVGARTLEECLLLQLRESSDPAAPLAQTLAAEHLPLLAQRDFTQLRRKTGASDDALRDAQALIRSLNPHPGAAFLDDASPFIIPDILVRRRTGAQAAGRQRWQALTNPDALPRLRINRLYSDLLRRSGDTQGGLSGQLQEARWLIKNIQQRFETIERVAQAIVEEQTEFFEKGELAMRPLVLREIADRLGLHESTISRVTSQKFMATPRGVLEFKYFFGSHVGTDDGGAASATAIKARTRQLVGDENPKKPLSDQQICDLFSAEGIVVARRTIAKYREAMGIPTASLRKTL
jgi:RNA polymerase sigma-54 factor